MLDAFGMDAKDIIALTDAARDSLSSRMLELSRRYLHEASPAACEAIRKALIAPWSAFSEAGQATTVLLFRDQPEASPLGMRCLARFSPTRSIYAM